MALRTYSDLDFRFTKHPVKKDLVLSYDEQAVIRSVKNLILTNHYERPFQPDIGSNVRRMLFEPISPLTANYLQREISDVIKNYEPRATLNEVFVDMSPDENSYTVYISFYLVNQSTPITINFLLQRLR
jgi:phage baseplate assembly protein W